MSRFQQLLFVVFALLLSALSVNAIPAAEGELKQAYDLQVVLHIADNPGLTDVFYDRVERELRDSLQADFGDLVNVNVVRDHPLLKDVLGKGLADTLKTLTERTGVKTHFVLIDFNGVDYEIQTCQYDGITGQPNPVIAVEKDRTPIVRQEKQRDRELVAKTAAQMVERDFGLSATFASWPQGKTKPQGVPLEFKGGGLVALDQWVKKGDVFAVVQVPTGAGTSQMIPDAIVLIQEPPRNGACNGLLYWRKLPGGGNVSYRCVKLGTVSGPLPLRVVEVKNNVLIAKEASLQIRHTGFTGEKDTLLSPTAMHGLFDSTKDGDKGIFDRVAFVSVIEGVKGEVRAEVPVPLLSDQPYLIKLSGQSEAHTLDELPKIAWKNGVNDAFAVMEQVIADIAKKATEAKDGSRKQIIALAQSGLERAHDDYPRLMAKKDELYGKGKTLSDADQRDVKQMDERLKSIDKRVKELTEFIAKQQKLEAEDNTPQMLEWKAKIEQGKLMEQDLEFGKALDLYVKIKADGYMNQELDAKIKQLHKLWDTEDDKYGEARDFIYKVFPMLDTAGLQTRMPDTLKAFEECKRVKDTIAAQKLFAGIGVHLPRLQKEGEGLSALNPDDDAAAKRLKEVVGALDKLLADLKIYIDSQKR